MDRIDARKTEELQALLRSAENIVTVSHTHPDGDAVGSSLGMAGWLRSLGKKAVTLFPDPVPETLAFMLDEEDRANCLIHSESPAAAEAALRQADLIFCLDFPSPSRTEGLAEVLRQAPAPKVLIDHHPGPEEDAFRLCFSETRISSASELVFWVLDALGAELPLKAATALMTGMTTDTNNFGNSTFPSTFEMASRLLERGVDREGILSAINQSYEERRLRAMGMLLDRGMVITPDGVAYMILDAATIRSYGLQDGDTEGFVNLPLAVRKVRMSLLLKQEKGHFRVSIRSKRGVSANRCAQRWFHGGGHEMAAGGKLFFPEDIPSPDGAAAYIEKVTHEEFI